MYTKSCICGGGTLNRINLKQADGYIHGNLSIKTSDNNIVSFHVFQNELTRNNKNNPSYSLMQKIMDDYKDCTSDNPDKVEIVPNSEYPNGSMRFKFDEHFKNIKRISKTDEPSNRIIFKIYGLMVNKFDGKYVYCTAMDYEKKMSDLKIVSSDEYEKGSVYDIVGYINEGLVDGIPIDNLVATRSRKSEEEIDFSEGIRVGEISPF